MALRPSPATTSPETSGVGFASLDLLILGRLSRFQGIFRRPRRARAKGGHSVNGYGEGTLLEPLRWEIPVPIRGNGESL